MFYHMSFIFEPRLKDEPPNSQAALNQVRLLIVFNTHTHTQAFLTMVTLGEDL